MKTQSAKVVCLIGEGMLELSRHGDTWRLGYGGDTLNTAIHLARSGLEVCYLTALGADPFSQDLRRAWAAEGLDTATVLTDPNRVPGLYAIANDGAGERSFTYWRGESAARGMFDLPGLTGALERAGRADLVIYSLITLAILPRAGRERLFSVCRDARARGVLVAFDGNYRPRLWDTQAEAMAARDAALRCCDIGLPTLDDETLLSGETTAEAVLAHWRGAGVGEVAVKLGALGCALTNGAVIAPLQVVDPVDTSGAGDAFNAGYLNARLAGGAPADAARAGHGLAAWTIARPGAIPARDAEAPYDLRR